MVHQFHPHIFREYDIRGTYGVDLSEVDAYEIGLRLTKIWQHQGLVCIARDGRLSSPALTTALILGLQEGGMEVVDIGIGPTPLLYYASKISPALAGIMVTGSHNQACDNGFKITLKTGPFFGKELQRILATLPKKQLTTGQLAQLDLKSAYIMRLLQDHPSAQRPLKVAWDPGNGSAGEIVKDLIAKLPGDHIAINTDIDGHFPAHHPDPGIAANLEQLQGLVLKNQCDVGLAFDGDGDRLGIVDNKGRMVSGDQLLALFAIDLLAKTPGATILADIKCGRVVSEVVKANGGELVMVKTGHSNIKHELALLKAVFAGEMSGHYYFADRYYGFDDGLYSALRVLEIIQATATPLSEMIDRLPQYVTGPEQRIGCKEELKEEIIIKLKAILSREGIPFIHIDGVRVETAEGWWLIRSSQTGPYLTTICEGRNNETVKKLDETIQYYLNLLLQ